MPKLINTGKEDAKERGGKTLKELVMGLRNVNFSMGATKQKGSVMLRKFGSFKPKSKDVLFDHLQWGDKRRDRRNAGRALLKGMEIALERRMEILRLENPKIPEK